MKFSVPQDSGLGEKNRDIIKQELKAESDLATGQGYYSGVYNMLFLLQARICKQLRGINMDEDLFQSYFVKVYKSIALMEAEFLKVMTKKERQGFLCFSKSMKELAAHF
jgi:hypothetical protein